MKTSLCSIVLSLSLTACAHTASGDTAPTTQPQGTAPTTLGGSGSGAAQPSGATGDQAQRIAAAVQAAFDAHKQRTKSYKDPSNQSVDMIEVEDLRFIVSASCLKPDGKLNCAAFEAVKTIRGRNVTVGPGTPASYYCQAAGGTEVAYTDAGGQSGVCRFADNSALSSWSLVYTPNIVLGEPAR